MARRRHYFHHHRRRGFSWKRALGITSAKQRFARWTGVPTTRSGRRAKMKRMTGCSGCLVEVLGVAALVIGALVLLL